MKITESEGLLLMAALLINLWHNPMKTFLYVDIAKLDVLRKQKTIHRQSIASVHTNYRFDIMMSV